MPNNSGAPCTVENPLRLDQQAQQTATATVSQTHLSLPFKAWTVRQFDHFLSVLLVIPLYKDDPRAGPPEADLIYVFEVQLWLSGPGLGPTSNAAAAGLWTMLR